MVGLKASILRFRRHRCSQLHAPSESVMSAVRRNIERSEGCWQVTSFTSVSDLYYLLLLSYDEFRGIADDNTEEVERK